MLAIEFGAKHRSCRNAVTARAACPVGTTQKQFYEKYCDRGDWLFWQLSKLSNKKRQEIKHLVEQALDIIIDRDIASMLVDIKNINKSWAVHLRTWGAAWLDGTDRSHESARAAERAVERAAGRAGSVAWRAARATWSAVERAAESATWRATRRATWRATWSVENKQQCAAVRRLIPLWPGGVRAKKCSIPKKHF